MAPFYPLFARRTDGKTQIRQKNGSFEPNEPTPEQLNQKPDAKLVCDFYRLCQYGDVKEVDWRRKLGGMLVREIAPNEPRDKNYILAALPENYRLFEHVRYRVHDAEGQSQRPVKNHAAGANERQDAYLYGHPFGRRKRFRSPAEFFPHLLWLATDESGDPGNCSCKLCSPEEIDLPKKEPLKTANKDIRQDARSKIAASAAAPAAAKPRPTSTSSTQPSTAIEPSPLPRFKSLQQKQDSQPQKSLFRAGEVVWFTRGHAWGLGVVTRRDMNQDTYKIQPLSHPFSHPQAVPAQEHELRPWLAWSPPPCTCQSLNPSPANGNRVYTYSSVDWPAVLQGRYGQCDAEVDGSILAAKSVEMTITPFQPTSSTANETHYNGIFAGAEKIWVGDPLRLRQGKFPTDILVLHDIIEQPGKGDPQRPRITLMGDTYCYRIAQLAPDSVPHDSLHLPSRVRADLEFRNSITMSNPDTSKRFSSFWRLDQKGVALSIADIKGRWYETRTLLPLLDAQGFEEGSRQGKLNDAGSYMNGQGDCNRLLPGTPAAQQARNGAAVSRPADIKMEQREAAFGGAVPNDFKISKGLDEPKRPESSGGKGGGAAPAPTAPQMRQQQQQPAVDQIHGLPASPSPPLGGSEFDEMWNYPNGGRGSEGVPRQSDATQEQAPDEMMANYDSSFNGLF